MSDDLLTTAEVAQMLRVSQKTISRWVRLEQLRALRLPSGQLRIRRSEVERVLRDGVETEEERRSPPRAQAATAVGTQARTSTAPARKRDRKDRPVAMAVVVQDGKALMTHRRYKEPAFQWNFVSGEVEPGETPEETALREVREETGLEIAIDVRLGDRIQPVSKRHMHYFICRVVGGALDLVDHEENTEVCWCTLEEVYQHFEELSRIPDGMYKPLFEYLDRVLTKTPV